MSYATHISRHKTPQSEQATPDQVQNSAGGFVFQVSPWTQLERFLILGSEGGTYYVSERKLTLANAKNVETCLALDPLRTVEMIREVSESGRAPKNDPAIFALAFAASSASPDARKQAMKVIPRVCRTGTHLFQFVHFVKEMRGWGRSLRRGVTKWYTTKSAHSLAYQIVKYPSRSVDKNSYTHRDVLRLAGGAKKSFFPSADTEAVLRYAVVGMEGMGERSVVRTIPSGQFRGEKIEKVYRAINPQLLPPIIHGWEAMKKATTEKEVVELISKYNLTREMVVTKWLSSPRVWEALLPNMPLTAMIRNLGNMSKVGLLTPLSDAEKIVISKLNAEDLHAARVHPVQVFSAFSTYRSGHGLRGSGIWNPCMNVVGALEGAFYASFKTVEPTGARYMLGLDVSGSMEAPISGLNMSCMMASAIMAMATRRVEPRCEMIAFSTTTKSVDIGPNDSLDQAMKKLNIPMGATDCAQPMIYAEKREIPVDQFVVYTDNQTWHGKVHPFQALKSYRQKMGIPAKLVVVGMTATEFTIADPSDPGMLDVVGFDTNTPKVISEFTKISS